MPNQHTSSKAFLSIYHPDASDVSMVPWVRSAAVAAVDADMRLNLWRLYPAAELDLVFGARDSMLQSDLDYVMALLKAAGQLATELAGAIARRDRLAADQTGAGEAPDA